jgi:tetratricopeptide (TPR) repeat protein
MKNKQIEGLKRIFTRFTNFRKKKSFTYYRDGLRLKRLGEKEAAIKEFKKALFFNLKFNKSLPNEEIAYSMALVYRSLEDPQKELKYYSKSLYYNPRFYKGWFWKGKTYLNLASKKRKDDGLSLRGRWLISLEKPKQFHREAIFCFINAIKSSDENPKPYYHAGCCYEQLGNSKKSVEMFDHVFELEPNFENNYNSKIFDKIKNVPRDKKECPDCQNDVKLEDTYCADCGTALK